MEDGPGGSASIEEQVADLCGSLAPNGGATEPSPASTLAELGFDSLACADLAAGLEDRFGVRLADADVGAIRTVADVAEAVRRRARAMDRIPPGIGRLQGTVKFLAGWAFRWQSRLRVEGADHLPADGPVVIAANHRSMLDIPLLVMASPRPVIFMAKRELWKFGALGWAWHEMGGFPVRREIADVRAIDIGLAVLERGEVLGLYPEGRRSKNGEMLPFLSGAGWMALKVGAPIVPCGISGTERLPRARRTLRKQVRVAFGPPIPVEREGDNALRRKRAEELTGGLLEEITKLLA
jgi:1-acyl-sn-glycerol-3-phosphate acyltransferase